MSNRRKSRYGRLYRELAGELFGYGSPEIAGVLPAEIDAAESRLQVPMPTPLREYYTELGAFPRLNEAHNRVVPPGELELYEGVLVLCPRLNPCENSSDSPKE